MVTSKTFFKEKTAWSGKSVFGKTGREIVCNEVGVTPVVGPTVCLEKDFSLYSGEARFINLSINLCTTNLSDFFMISAPSYSCQNKSLCSAGRKGSPPAEHKNAAEAILPSTLGEFSKLHNLWHVLNRVRDDFI